MAQTVDSVSAFITMFKKALGKSPARYFSTVSSEANEGQRCMSHRGVERNGAVAKALRALSLNLSELLAPDDFDAESCKPFEVMGGRRQMAD